MSRSLSVNICILSFLFFRECENFGLVDISWYHYRARWVLENTDERRRQNICGCSKNLKIKYTAHYNKLYLKDNGFYYQWLYYVKSRYRTNCCILFYYSFYKQMTNLETKSSTVAKGAETSDYIKYSSAIAVS